MSVAAVVELPVGEVLASSLMACMISSVWLMRTSGMILYSVHVVSVRIRRITLTKKSFTATCFGPVSCPAIIVEPSTERLRK